jgi:hypothetical protein
MVDDTYTSLLIHIRHEGNMSNVRMIVQVPKTIKAKLDALRAEGTTASGLIRRLLNEFFGKPARVV